MRSSHLVTILVCWRSVILATLVCVACTSAKIRNPPQGVTNTTAANIQRESARSVPSKSPIRSIDFNNFTYPAKPIYRRGQTTFTLTNGHYEGRVRMTGGTGPFGDPYPISLVDVVYEDITGDGKEDAIVVLYERVAGTAIPYYVYIFSMNSDRTRLLWGFAAGDRADGGLRRVYGENGNLIVELYGKNTRVGELEDKEKDGADCCPKFFSRTRYTWNGSRFVPSGKSEVIPNPGENSNYSSPTSTASLHLDTLAPPSRNDARANSPTRYRTWY